MKEKPISEKPATVKEGQAERNSEETAVETADRQPKDRADGKVVLDEFDHHDELGFGFPKIKKWAILSVIFMVQISMNLK